MESCAASARSPKNALESADLNNELDLALLPLCPAQYSNTMMAASLCIPPQAAGNPPMDRFWSNAIAHYKSPNLSTPAIPPSKRARTSSMPALEPMFLPSMSSSILPPSIPSMLSRMPHSVSSPTPSISENFQANKYKTHGFHACDWGQFFLFYFWIFNSIPYCSGCSVGM